jgi:3-deoxy-D-manno-octulosonate 8-phosphate phosphatase (KDO 8-P phosphatase)
MAKKKYSFAGNFISPERKIKDKLKHIKAIIFDWDGIFNNGQKSAESGSIFSEVDSMGTNLLRYSLSLKNGKIPVTAVISGEKNKTAFYFCGRESFNSSYFKFPNKIIAFKHFCETNNLKASEVMFVFDDVLDLPIAETCGLRILVDQKANPAFVNYCIKHKMVDYITANKGGDHAVRETCELLISLNGNFDEVITTRKDYDKKYLFYIEDRRRTITKFFTLNNGKIVEEKIA